MDRLCDRNAWLIKEIEVVVTADGSDNNIFQRCACVRGTSLGSFPWEDYEHGDWTCRLL